MRQTLRRAWIPLLGVALSLTSALAHKDHRQDPATAPGFSRIDTSSAPAMRFEGTGGAPGDRIALHVDGQQAARVRVDARGERRTVLDEPLSPGTYAARSVSIGQGNGAARVSEDVRTTIPDGDLPVYASSGKGEHVDVGPPDAATLRRASELARDASRMFSKVIKEEQDSGSQDQLTDEQGAAGGETYAQSREPRPVWPVESIMAWLIRARHDYNEVLVKGLSDPARRREDGYGSLMAESPLPSGSPATAWPESDAGPTAGYLSVAAGWLQRSSRDYHDFLVRELILRGIKDEQQRELARAAMSKMTIAAASEADTGKDMPGTRAGPGGQAEERRLAEARRLEEERAAAGRRDAEERARQREAREARTLAEAQVRAEAEAEAQRQAELRRQELERESQRLAEARRLEEERAAAGRRDIEERARQREAGEAGAVAEARARAEAEEQRLAEIRRQEEERAREAQRLAEARQAFALYEYLAARPQDTRPPAGKVPELKPQSGKDSVAARASAERLADVPPPVRIDAATRGSFVAPVPTRIDPGTREHLMAELAAERARKVDEARRQRSQKRPRISTRTASRQPVRATRATGRRKPSTVRKSRRSHHVRARSQRRYARNHGCRPRRAGRAIRPPGTYVVAYGDTLWSIAERHYGSGHRYRRIRHADGRSIVRPHRIYPCQRVWLPRHKHRSYRRR